MRRSPLLGKDAGVARRSRITSERTPGREPRPTTGTRSHRREMALINRHQVRPPDTSSSSVVPSNAHAVTHVEMHLDLYENMQTKAAVGLGTPTSSTWTTLGTRTTTAHTKR